MGLDINTKKGQKTLVEEINMLKYISKCCNITLKTTPKDKPYPHDGGIFVYNEITGIFECKNRQCTFETLENWGSWLVTYSKLEKCREIAKKLKVPFYGFLGIQLNHLAMAWKISDAEGNYLFPFEHYISPTQETVNGGWIERDNAFLPLEFGRNITPDQDFNSLFNY